jgi:hypothetical protein
MTAPPQAFVSVRMHPYVHRVRLRIGCGFDPDPTSEKAMRKILRRRGVRGERAKTAVHDMLQAALDHQLAQVRNDQHRKEALHSHKVIDRLISCLEELRRRIVKLPPRSRALINQRLQPSVFDTETFIDVLTAVANALTEVPPKRLADEARAVIEQPLPTFKKLDVRPISPEETSPLILDLWVSLPAVTRIAVERAIRSKRAPESLSDWLRTLSELLDQERLAAPKQGAPSFTA